MNYFLMTHDYPPLVVKNETKNVYYNALGTYDKTGEVKEFVSYMKAAMEETWEVKRAPVKNLEHLLEQ